MSRGKSGAEPAGLSQLNLNAAGIDVGASSHFVAVPADRTEQPVQEFEAFTADLYRLADWLAECGVKTVAMESTGVYWIPLFGVLEERGFEVMLVDPRRIKNVPGRKTDVLDCQWLQQLHTYGLLSGAFRPEDEIRRLRSYLRQRAMLVEHAARHVQHMQKALTQMNVKLQHVIRDITGKTGMDIIEAIVQGERSPRRLARLRDPRTKSDERTIARSLQGHWRQEHLFELTQALELYRTYQADQRQLVLPVGDDYFCRSNVVIIRYRRCRIGYGSASRNTEAETNGRKDATDGGGDGWDERALGPEVAARPVAVGDQDRALVAHPP